MEVGVVASSDRSPTTSVQVPTEHLDELIRLTSSITGSTTKKDAINFAIDRTRQLLRQQEANREFLAAGDLFLSPGEAYTRHQSMR